MRVRGFFKVWALAAAIAAGAIARPAAAAEPLRVCADPDNLPFSKAEGPERGLYVELAELVGKQLERPVAFTWWLTYNERRALRNTIIANTCDAVIALPAAADYRVRGVQKSRPFMDVSYAVVAAPEFKFASLDDLKRVRIGVVVATTPHVLVSRIDGFRSTTFRDSGEVFAALAAGQVDVGLLWGPVAGYENKTLHGERWRVTALSGMDLSGQVVIGVRRDQPELAAAIDKALLALAPQIEQLAAKYRFPRGPAVALAYTAPAVAVAAAQVVRVAESAPNDVQSARTKFNSQCSHCHGTDAVSPLRERDLRRLQLRYSDGWRELASTTIANGRPDKGMPTWKDSLDEAEIKRIVGFLATLQK